MNMMKQGKIFLDLTESLNITLVASEHVLDFPEYQNL